MPESLNAPLLTLNCSLSGCYLNSFVKHSMKEAREGHMDGVKQLASEIESLDKAIAVLDKQASSAQSNLVDFLKSNNIPFQMR